MQLFTFSTDQGMQIGLKKDDTLINLSSALEIYEGNLPENGLALSLFISIDEMLSQGLLNMEFLGKMYKFLEDGGHIPALLIKEMIDFGLPLYDVFKIIALGRNYEAHAKEGGHKVAEEPIFFNKVPSIMLPHNGEIIYPPGVTRVDHEIELAVVIGEVAKDVSVSEAMNYVAGYTIANDITARDMQKADIAKGHPWFRSKNFDTFLPIGPYLTPRDAVPDVHNLDMELKVNGETRQKSNTSQMVFKIPEIISYISRHMRLLPGDIILTGTPEGISPLAVGDVVEATIEGLGTLKNIVVGQ